MKNLGKIEREMDRKMDTLKASALGQKRNTFAQFHFDVVKCNVLLYEAEKKTMDKG